MLKEKNIVGILAFGDEMGGGIYQYTQSLIDALKGDESNKYVVFCNKNDNRFDTLPLEVRKVNKRNRNLQKKMLEYFLIIFNIRKPITFTSNELGTFEDIDLFISPSISLYPHFFIGKPFIFTLHDMQERYYPQFFSKKERFFRWLNARVLCKEAISIICESRFVKNDIIKFLGISKDKISIIESPPPEEFLNFNFKVEKIGEVIRKYNLPDNFIFYPAQDWPHKNHLKLVEAFNIVKKTNPNVSLVFIGSQKENFDVLMEKINNLNLQESIVHLGYIDYEDLPYLYKLSEMLVMPSLFESVSIPIFEAFSIGTPVVCSNVVALPEQVGDSALVFNPIDILDISNKIIMLLENEKLKNDLVKKGFERIKNFNHENYKTKLIQLIS
tara:strand:+ start:251 stop:1405 length:1155 start_codon:yes stop_codon:yes gene_type:complete